MYKRSVRSLALLAAVALALLSGPVMAQESGAAAGADRKVPISFLPPPLETATYSVGIYDAKTRRLVRRLHEAASTTAFTVGLNGLITSWDGRDDNGKPAPVGRYAARGYAVGALKVEGKAVLGNDWAADDENLRISGVDAIALVPEDGGLVIFGADPALHGVVARYGGEKCELMWQKTGDKLPVDIPINGVPTFGLQTQGGRVVASFGMWLAAYQLADGGPVTLATPFTSPANDSKTISGGRDGTTWKIEEGVLAQYSAHGERLRSLAPQEGDPVPVAVTASKDSDRLYLLEYSKETGPKNIQTTAVVRVRGLSWKESIKEGDKAVSNWTTFFENSIHRDFSPAAADNTPLTASAEVSLVENPLSPGKPERLKLAATFDAKGSYLATADGLHLRQISQRANLRSVKLGKSKGGRFVFYQNDGAAWDEFTVEGAREMMSFDAGEFELTATGEKPVEKPVDPDL